MSIINANSWVFLLATLTIMSVISYHLSIGLMRHLEYRYQCATIYTDGYINGQESKYVPLLFCTSLLIVLFITSYFIIFIPNALSSVPSEYMDKANTEIRLFHPSLMLNVGIINVLMLMLIIPFFACAMDFDARYRIIPNMTILAILGISVIMVAIRVFIIYANSPHASIYIDDIIYQKWIPSVLVCMISFIPYLKRGIGTGDFKLMAAVVFAIGLQYGIIAIGVAIIGQSAFMIYHKMKAAPFAPFMMPVLIIYIADSNRLIM